MSTTLCTILTLLAVGKFPDHCLKDDAPWFCHELDCPPYKVLRTLGQDVELRSYQGGVWVSTNMTSMDYDKAVRTGFMRLYAYISGANEEKRPVDMTAPVRVEMTPGAGPFCEDHFKVSFYVPSALQDSPPKPLSEEVFVDLAPATKYYVLSYGGHTYEEEIVDKATQLVKLLGDEELPYSFSSFFHAGYDSPFRLFNRHNEVWINTK